MGKQSGITPSLPRRPGRNSVRRDQKCAVCGGSAWAFSSLHVNLFQQLHHKKGEKESAKSLQIGAVVLLADLVIATYVCNRWQCVQAQVVLSSALTLCQWWPFHWAILLGVCVRLSRTEPRCAPLQRVSAQQICCKIQPLSGSCSYKYELWTQFRTEQQCNIYLTLH